MAYSYGCVSIRFWSMLSCHWCCPSPVSSSWKVRIQLEYSHVIESAKRVVTAYIAFKVEYVEYMRTRPHFDGGVTDLNSA